MIGKVCLRPVGTRGGRGEGWWPCACPGGLTSGLGCVRPTGLLPTRTSTRPPHPPHCAPCPYRTQDAPSPIRSAPFSRRLGRKRPNGDDYPIRLATFIIGQWPVDALPRPINRRCANKLCAYGVFPMLLALATFCCKSVSPDRLSDAPLPRLR